MRLALCIRGVDEAELRQKEFYWQDWLALQHVADQVEFVSHPRQLRGQFDAAVVWWWNYLWLWGPVLRARRIPILAVGVFDVDTFADLSFPKRLLKRRGIPFARLHAMVSQYEIDRAARFGFPMDRVRYAPHAIDGNFYVAQLRPSTAPPYVLNIGWHEESNLRRKMVFELLEAFAAVPARFPDVRLVLAGRHGDGAARLQQHAQSLGIAHHVDFPGEVTREAKLALLQGCSLYCQVSHYEGFGLATAEALSCATPVLVSRVGAVPEVVGDCGAYVDEISTAGIRTGLMRCLATLPALREQAQRGAQRMRERFSCARRRADFAALLRELLADRSTAPTAIQGNVN